MLRVKVVLLGDSDVGKTALIRKGATGEFSPYSNPTIGTEVDKIRVEEDGVELHLWDTAGQERYQSLGAVFYRGSEVCLLVYDITSSKSFDALDVWREEFISLACPKDSNSFPFIVVGTKMDRETERKVPFGRVQAWKHTGKCVSHMECSAKTGENVRAVFKEVAWWAVNTRKPVGDRLSTSPQRITLSKAVRPPPTRPCCR